MWYYHLLEVFIDFINYQLIITDYQYVHALLMEERSSINRFVRLTEKLLSPDLFLVLRSRIRVMYTAQKMKLSIKDFFRKRDQIRCDKRCVTKNVPGF